MSAVTWAIEQGGVSPRNIVLIGHSLGTAVSTAVYHHFSTQGKPLGGLALIAPFTNVPKLTTTYRVGGIVPLLQPLALFPAVQTWGTSQVRDKWQTELRLAEVAASGQGHKITIFHARSDFAIPCHHALSLYQTLCSGKAEWRPVDPPGFEASKSTTASGKTLWTASQQSANGSEFRLFLFRQGCEWTDDGYRNSVLTRGQSTMAWSNSRTRREQQLKCSSLEHFGPDLVYSGERWPSYQSLQDMGHRLLLYRHPRKPLAVCS